MIFIKRSKRWDTKEHYPEYNKFSVNCCFFFFFLKLVKSPDDNHAFLPKRIFLDANVTRRETIKREKRNRVLDRSCTLSRADWVSYWQNGIEYGRRLSRARGYPSRRARKVHKSRLEWSGTSSYPSRYICSFNASRRANRKKTSLRDCQENVAHRVDFILDSYIQLIDSERESPFCSNSQESQEKNDSIPM